MERVSAGGIYDGRVEMNSSEQKLQENSSRTRQPSRQTQSLVDENLDAVGGGGEND